jgi:hypothetical protein
MYSAIFPSLLAMAARMEKIVPWPDVQARPRRRSSTRARDRTGRLSMLPHAESLASARHALDDLTMLARLTRDAPAFLRRRITVEQAVAWQRQRLAAREAWFLRVAERQIFGFPRSPYLALLRAVGCEPGDLRALVRQEGLEGALVYLARLGVYVTYDEFKGRREVVRGSRRFRFAEHDFDNPRAVAHYEVLSGGTRGRRGRVPRSLSFIVETGYCVAPAFEAHGVLRAHQAFWSNAPINHLLRFPMLGVPMAAWFYPLAPLSWRVRFGAGYLVALGRLMGHRLPRPVHCDLQLPERIVAWLMQQRREGKVICLLTAVSSAVRIAAAALEAGRSLEGVTFFVRSEPYTAARQQTIEASGARVFVNFASAEVSTIGISCAEPAAPDDVHFFESLYALARRTRRVGEGGPEIDALLFSSLTDHVPKTLLNVETGDYAEVERRDCGCKLGALGLHTHLSQIRSFEKLTGEGMTFARTNLAHVVEVVLPARFGGTGIDYQVLEEERGRGLPRLVLRVSPTVGQLHEATVRSAFLEALAHDGAMERYMAAFWQRASTIEIERKPPFVTPAGKILSFQLVRGSNVRLNS